jgi:hypothetical protein
MIFTGFLSVTFLNNKISNVKWLGIITCCTGLVIVGISDFISSKNVSFIDTNGIITGSLHLFLNFLYLIFIKFFFKGDLLIIISRIIQSAQLIYEEKYIKKYSVPSLIAAGCEGVFGKRKNF